jgi:hypothetical protein
MTEEEFYDETFDDCDDGVSTYVPF